MATFTIALAVYIVKEEPMASIASIIVPKDSSVEFLLVKPIMVSM